MSSIVSYLVLLSFVFIKLFYFFVMYVLKEAGYAFWCHPVILLN